MGNTVFDDQGNWRGVKLVVPGSLITMNVNGSSGFPITVYTVPSGKTLYISNWSASCRMVDSADYSLIAINDSTGARMFVLQDNDGGTNTITPFAVNCAIPLILLENYSIIITGAGVAYGSFSFQGWLE